MVEAQRQVELRRVRGGDPEPGLLGGSTTISQESASRAINALPIE